MIHKLWSDFAAPLVALVCLGVIIGYIVNQIVDDDGCDFCPVRLQQLELQPSVVHVGEEATLLDGICNDSGLPLTIKLYLGADPEGLSVIGSRPVALLTKLDETGARVQVTDDEKGMLSVPLEPGCSRTAPIKGPIPATLSPGMWRLRVHIVTVGPEGQVQDFTVRTPPFEVRAAR